MVTPCIDAANNEKAAIAISPTMTLINVPDSLDKRQVKTTS